MQVGGYSQMETTNQGTCATTTIVSTSTDWAESQIIGTSTKTNAYTSYNTMTMTMTTQIPMTIISTSYKTVRNIFDWLTYIALNLFQDFYPGSSDLQYASSYYYYYLDRISWHNLVGKPIRRPLSDHVSFLEETFAMSCRT